MTAVQTTDARRSTRRTAVRALSVAAVALTLALVVLAAAFWALYVRSAGTVEAGRPVQVEIEQGASTAEIARVLVDAGVVGNVNMFKLRARFASADGALKAGVYDFRTGTSYGDAIERLQKGPQAVYNTVTIPEGFVIDQIAQRLDEQAGIPADEFAALAKTGAARFSKEHPYLAQAYQGSLEGYLFPKTYRIKEGSSAYDVAEMMLDQFDQEIAQVDFGHPESLGMSLNDSVVLASMIEREAKVPDERPLISSVIYNRLQKNMLLEIDATLEYVLPGNRFRLRSSDLKLESPYNTYRHKGLPPGPISNPGLASLKAAAQPDTTTYLFYVLTGKDGTHTFCTTLDEFLVAKAKSKEVFGK